MAARRPPLLISLLTEFQFDFLRRLMKPSPARPKRKTASVPGYLPQTESFGNLQGICPDCDTMIYRRASRARLNAICAVLDITFSVADPRIRERNTPSVICDSSGDG